MPYVKSIPWHAANFKGLLDYITKEKDEEHDLRLDIHFNTRQSNNIEDLALQFKNNDLIFRKERKKGVALYHEVLSFSASDRDNLNPAIIEDIVREYLSMRAPGAMAFGSTHVREDHIHVHLCVAGTNYRSPTVTRLEKKDFIGIRKSLEEYQKLLYPELKHSIAYGEREQHRESKKDLLDRIIPDIEHTLEHSQDTEDLRRGLALQGLELYYHNGKPIGVKVDEQKFRFRRLNVDISKLHIRKPQPDHIIFSEFQDRELPSLQHEILKLREQHRQTEDRSEAHQDRLDLLDRHIAGRTQDPDRAQWYEEIAKNEGRLEEYRNRGITALEYYQNHIPPDAQLRQWEFESARTQGKLDEYWCTKYPEQFKPYPYYKPEPTEQTQPLPDSAYAPYQLGPIKAAFQESPTLEHLQNNLTRAGMQTYNIAGELTGVMFQGFRTSLSFLGFSLATFRNHLRERQFEEYKRRQKEHKRYVWEQLTPEEKQQQLAYARAGAWQQREQEAARGRGE